ncbi:hypothetical protein KPH14_010546 [Odynerus spinipes]|uniref:NADH dehydrogenase [ubiquinone] 1 subunit C2 n=1 Tax=Odynerus spinipes TaxID=1348599 RepID=A0AAD9RU29_9HYME|nr:hypothetical protein KPH14_010546 [Odynerus spinipes]
MAENPDIQWALDILTPDPDYKPSQLVEYGLIVGTPLSLFVASCWRNKSLRRPMLAGIHVHIISSLLGFVGAYSCKEVYENHFARRDQMLRHYVTLHPEDFPPPERKKWSEVFDPWYPIR